MYTDMLEAPYKIEDTANGKIIGALPVGCRGCKFDPTYTQRRDGAVCNTAGCDGESEYRPRKTVQGKYANQ